MSDSTNPASQDIDGPQLAPMARFESRSEITANALPSACCGGLFRCAGTEALSAFMVIAAIFVVATVGHWLMTWLGTPGDTAWFAATGFGFVAVTAISHCVVSKPSSDAPLAPLMVSMAIRLAGTFLILGMILKLSPLSRPEAVFNVLFWYITLTSADLIGVVRLKNRESYVVSLVSEYSTSGDRA
jgi:hypothetical protein